MGPHKTSNIRMYIVEWRQRIFYQFIRLGSNRSCKSWKRVPTIPAPRSWALRFSMLISPAWNFNLKIERSLAKCPKTGRRRDCSITKFLFRRSVGLGWGFDSVLWTLEFVATEFLLESVQSKLQWRSKEQTSNWQKWKSKQFRSLMWKTMKILCDNIFKATAFWDNQGDSTHFWLNLPCFFKC